jgi:hypothetical protein
MITDYDIREYPDFIHTLECIPEEEKPEKYISHLEKNKQTYFEHFKDSICYSGQAFKASFYFFIHGFVPEAFQTNGSDTIFYLNNTIKTKYNM